MDRENLAPIEWATTHGLTGYEFALATMEARVHAIGKGTARELIWLVEHPALYTAGTSAKPQDLLETSTLPVFVTGRGGQYTYHGPGQRVVYVMLDVRRRYNGDVKRFVDALEGWVILALARFGVRGEVRPGRVGVWVERMRDERLVEEKIAAIGIRVRHGVSFHGLSLNIAPDLSHYGGIVPCGLADLGVTSLLEIGCPQSLKAVDNCLQEIAPSVFDAPIVVVGEVTPNARSKDDC